MPIFLNGVRKPLQPPAAGFLRVRRPYTGRRCESRAVFGIERLAVALVAVVLSYHLLASWLESRLGLAAV